ncbi:Alkyl hydroperoxide reductase subunit C-like protein [Helicobacter bizzozeronii CCUG 35545]|nr:Alkyl hydroperoxide reductase subunit C-like protein [Helicobacter bizzozeronii CCUG 35545]
MLVTKLAPDFKATAILPNNQVDEHFELSKNLGRNGAVLVFLAQRFYFCVPL